MTDGESVAGGVESNQVNDVRRHHPRQIRVAGERQQVGVEMVRLDRGK